MQQGIGHGNVIINLAMGVYLAPPFLFLARNSNMFRGATNLNRMAALRFGFIHCFVAVLAVCWIARKVYAHLALNT
jgi:hypothetical protein